jgi:hypothetical protein
MKIVVLPLDWLAKIDDYEVCSRQGTYREKQTLHCFRLKFSVLNSIYVNIFLHSTNVNVTELRI